MMKASSKKSRKKASRKIRMLTAMRKPIGAAGQSQKQVLDPLVTVHAVKARGLKTRAPTRMKMTNAVKLRRRRPSPGAAGRNSAAGLARARSTAPVAPIAPPSVGVASPMKIVPSTRKISAQRRHHHESRPAAPAGLSEPEIETCGWRAGHDIGESRARRATPPRSRRPTWSTWRTARRSRPRRSPRAPAS